MDFISTGTEILKQENVLTPRQKDIIDAVKAWCIVSMNGRYANKSSLKRQVSASFFLQYGKSGNVPVTLTSKRQNNCARTAEIFNCPGAFCG